MWCDSYMCELTPRSRVLPERLTGYQLVKKLLAFCGTPKFITPIRKSPQPVSMLSQISMPLSHFLKMHFNIILPSVPGSSKWSPLLRFRHQNPVCTTSFPHTLYMSCLSQSSSFDQLNDIWCGVQSSKLFVM